MLGAKDYLILIERALTGIRMRIRYGEQVSLEEIHDVMDALHNIPALLRGTGEWYNEEKIREDLARYDRQWMERGDSEMRQSLVQMLESIREESAGPEPDR
jgi:hypothetical protein